jgi:Mlc titration factor MtfA (ptsG expression regulator)
LELYASLCVYHHAIRIQDIWCGVYYHLATKMLLMLQAYFDKCLEIIATFDDFTIQHVSRDENTIVNNLAQRASGFRSNQEKLYVLEKWMFWFAILDVSVCS